MSKRTAVVGLGHEVMSRSSALLVALLFATAAPGVVSSATAQNRASNDQWEVPRTPDGHPDLQGNWTNQSMTPIQRREGLAPVYTPEEVAEIEQGYVDRTVEGALASDPDRPPPPPKAMSCTSELISVDEDD